MLVVSFSATVVDEQSILCPSATDYHVAATRPCIPHHTARPAEPLHTSCPEIMIGSLWDRLQASLAQLSAARGMIRLAPTESPTYIFFFLLLPCLQPHDWFPSKEE